MNRLRMEHRASLSSAERELERVRGGIRRIIDAIKDGFAGPELKAEMDELQARKESLLAQLAAADEPMLKPHSLLIGAVPPNCAIPRALPMSSFDRRRKAQEIALGGRRSEIAVQTMA
jgi:hypothetical protein